MDLDRDAKVRLEAFSTGCLLGVYWNPGNKLAACEKAQEWGDRIPIGVIYRKERDTFEERLPALRKGPLVRRKLDPMQAEELLGEFL